MTYGKDHVETEVAKVLDYPIIILVELFETVASRICLFLC